VPLTGLAKQEEELFVPGSSRSILLPRRSEALYLVQRVRDEAHRFANEGHRSAAPKWAWPPFWTACPASAQTAQDAADPFRLPGRPAQSHRGRDRLRAGHSLDVAEAIKANLA
jgi:hypothetical protein